MLIRSASGEYEVVDFRETAPAGASENMFKNGQDSIYGGLARFEIREQAYKPC
jgi:gamma-glutamyltranspeptidase/glutathione hydrolase